MSLSDADRARQLTVELLRRGATLLREPCPKCGGLMVRYRGVEFCPRCSGFKSLEEVEEKLMPPEDLLKGLEEAVLARLREGLSALREEAGPEARRAQLELVKEELEVLESIIRVRERMEQRRRGS